MQLMLDRFLLVAMEAGRTNSKVRLQIICLLPGRRNSMTWFDARRLVELELLQCVPFIMFYLGRAIDTRFNCDIRCFLIVHISLIAVFFSVICLCTAVNCKIPAVKNGRVIANETAYLSSARVTCNRGYELFGSATITCEANNRWTSQGTCNGKVALRFEIRND